MEFHKLKRESWEGEPVNTRAFREEKNRAIHAVIGMSPKRRRKPKGLRKAANKVRRVLNAARLAKVYQVDAHRPKRERQQKAESFEIQERLTVLADGGELVLGNMEGARVQKLAIVNSDGSVEIVGNMPKLYHGESFSFSDPRSGDQYEITSDYRGAIVRKIYASLEQQPDAVEHFGNFTLKIYGNRHVVTNEHKQVIWDETTWENTIERNFQIRNKNYFIYIEKSGRLIMEFSVSENNVQTGMGDGLDHLLGDRYSDW